MAKYILFDTETTGAGEEDRILQVGAMVIEGEGKTKEVSVFDELCKPDVKIKIEAMEVHGITPELIENKPPYSSTAFSKMVEENNIPENFLIAHNINFDLGMIQKEGFVNKYTLVDTLRVARHLYPYMPSHRLQYIRYALKLYKGEEKEAEKHGIVIKAHDAIGDVLVMKLFLSELTAEVKALYPNENPIKKMGELTKIPIMVKTFKFGKYKGQYISDIAVRDNGYLRWMKNNMDLDEDMTHTLITHLG